MSCKSHLNEALQGRRLLIFDFDGTVVDTSPLHAAAFSRVLAPFNIRVDYPAIAGMKTLDAIVQLLDNANIKLDDAQIADLVTAKQWVVRQLMSQGLQPMAGVDAFLQWARPRYKMAMVTSGSRGTVSLALNHIGYTGWFDPLICADDVNAAKPAPDGYLMALDLAGIKPSEALVFEDSEAGFRAANQANLDYIDVRSTPLTSDNL